MNISMATYHLLLNLHIWKYNYWSQISPRAKKSSSRRRTKNSHKKATILDIFASILKEQERQAGVETNI